MAEEEGGLEVTLLLFAKGKELAGVGSMKLKLPESKTTCYALKELIFKMLPSLEPLRERCLFAVNRQYCTEPNQELKLWEGVEIAIIPPVSGG